MGTIRRATSADLQILGDMAAEVFRPYGNDYGLMIPAYSRDVRVITLVYEEGKRPVGFVQVGFLEAAPGERKLIADILAVAVTADHRNKGLGTALFERVFELMSPMRERGTVSDVQLTVADTNHRAARLFERLGFRPLNQEYGTYEGGQRAIRMGLGALPDPEPL